MMPEEALAILQQIPDNDHVDHKDAADNPGKALATHPVHQFIHLDRDEKGRFADGQPAGPAHPEHQADSFHQRKEAVNQGARSGPEDVGLGYPSDLRGEVGKEGSLGIEPQQVQQMPEFRRKIVVGQRVGHDGQRHKQEAFEQFDADNGIKRRRAFFDHLGVA